MRIEVYTEDTKLISIINDYWEINDDFIFSKTLNCIADSHGIKRIEISKIIAEYSSALALNKRCELCSTLYEYKNRKDYKSKTYQPWKCDQCQHIELENIKAKKLIEDELKIDEVLETFVYTQENFPVAINKLSARQAIFLLALVRFSASEDYRDIHSYEDYSVNMLSPNKEFDLRIIDELYEENVISISPSTSPDFLIMNDDHSYSFCRNLVKWVIPLPKDAKIQMFIHRLEEKISSMDYLVEEPGSILGLQHEIALEECFTYLKITMSEYRFDFTPGDRTKSVFEKALQHYSVSQIFNIIWSGARSAAAYAQRGNIPKKQAANSVVGSIERQLERSLTEGWSITPYNRTQKTRQSVVSQVIYNLLLKSADSGFQKPLYETETIHSLFC